MGLFKRRRGGQPDSTEPAGVARTPDPCARAFGYKIVWLAIRSDSAQEVAGC